MNGEEAPGHNDSKQVWRGDDIDGGRGRRTDMTHFKGQRCLFPSFMATHSPGSGAFRVPGNRFYMFAGPQADGKLN